VGVGKGGDEVIARVNFKGIVMRGPKKLVMRDHVDIHLASLKSAEAMFKMWMARADGIRGDSGVFHPLKTYGKIEIMSIKEATAE
jgi:hypothetical protein